MAIVAEWVKIDSARMLESLATAQTKLDAGESEVVLDFSSVERLDAAALNQLSELGALSSKKSARLALRGVNIGVYRVLKTSKIADEFIFLS